MWVLRGWTNRLDVLIVMVMALDLGLETTQVYGNLSYSCNVVLSFRLVRVIIKVWIRG